MTGYVRQDTSNNISNGSVIDADDLDLEFNAVEAAFNSSTGHNHDGTSGEGSPILVVGPAQDIVTTSGQMAPKADDTYDLGSATNKWKDLYVDGVAYIDTLASPVFTGSIFNNGSSGSNIVSVAALAIDCSAGNYFTKTISADSTFTFNNVPSSQSYGFTLELTLTSGTITWPAAVKFPGNTTPVVSTGKTHLFMFLTDDGGTRWRGAALTDYDN